MKQRDIIVVGIQPWDIEMGSNCKNIATEFAKRHRVLYVNAPLDRISQLRNKGDVKVQNRTAVIKGREQAIQPIGPNLWNFNPPIVLESINWMPRAMFRLFNKINNMRFARAISDAIVQLGFSDYIIFNDSDMFRSFHLAELLTPALYIYYTRDNLMTVPYWRKHGQSMEPELFAKADLVVANSPHLADKARVGNKHAHYVGQGCETEYYRPENVKVIPAELKNIHTPIIGYIGLLTSRRLDISVIEYIARERPDWSIVLVGPEEECFRKSNLHQLSNIHFIGPKPPETLPGYVKGFDVCINPQIINELTKGNYPRKIDEYLAMGKPVVATYTPTMEVFASHTYLVQEEKSYVHNIEIALAEDSSEMSLKRQQFASGHTWKNNVDEIWKAVERVQNTLKSKVA